MTTLVSHFVMIAPPPEVPSEVHARAMSERLSLMPVKLNHEEIRSQLQLIGDDWHMRPEHTDSKRIKATKKTLESARTHTWFFMRGDQQIGFCCTVKGGFDRSLVEKFGIASDDTTEIYKVGLHREYTSKGLGKVFLPAIQTALFDGQIEIPDEGIKAVKPSEAIYLNTRDSNTVDSRGFYSRLGYKAVGQEQIIEAGSNKELGFQFVPAPGDEQNNGVQATQAPIRRRPLSPNMPQGPRSAVA